MIITLFGIAPLQFLAIDFEAIYLEYDKYLQKVQNVFGNTL